jgi:hypothetical protein
MFRKAAVMYYNDYDSGVVLNLSLSTVRIIWRHLYRGVKRI